MFKILIVMLKKIKCDVKNIKRDIYNITLLWKSYNSSKRRLTAVG